NGATCYGGGTGLRAGAAAGCGGGTEILSRIPRSAASSLVLKSCVICSWPAARWANLWGTAAGPSDIAVSSRGTGEDVAGTVVSRAVLATAASGANQPSCGYEFAMICLAASP